MKTPMPVGPNPGATLSAPIGHVAPPPPVSPVGGNGASSAADSVTPQQVIAKMNLNPQQAAQLQRIVVAGMKVMFSPQTHQKMMQQMLQIPGSIADKVGQGVAGLMGLLVQQSQNSLPKNMIIPAATILCIHAYDFLKKSGQQVQPSDLGAIIQICVHAILRAAKVDPDKLAAMGAQAGGQQPPPAAPMAPAAPMGDPNQPAMGS